MHHESSVDQLFGRLTLRYGAAFLRQWPDADLSMVKADWAHVLRGLPGSAVKGALETLPDKPPNASQFRKLCLDAIKGEERRVFTALPAPRVPMPNGVRERLSTLLQRQAHGAVPAEVRT